MGDRDLYWLLGALGVLIALQYILGIEPRSTASWVLWGLVLLGFAFVSSLVFVFKRDR